MAATELKNQKELNQILQQIKMGHHFLLSGGAGSGKTFSLVEVLQSISSLVPSAHIACITYTNAAAIEIKNRASVKNLRVSTIHDFLWDSIAQFQKELKVTLLELINEPDNVIKSPTPGEIYSNEFENGIQYKEYVRISNGEISHDEVLLLAHRMFKKYPRLCDLLLDKFQFIFVDEYQDTSPLVIEILLNFLQTRKKKNIIGFFGDSMQSIYETGVGDIDRYIEQGIVVKVIKEQNRRNPQSVIDIANALRTDGLIQQPSDDISAPNMENGVVKQGTVKFAYSKSFDLNELIRMTSFRVQSVADKVKLKTAIEHLKAQNGASIATVISYAHKEGLCIIDDKLQEFIDNNEYLYWRVSDIAFVEVQNLYKYIEGHMPFSTQHKIKGLEFKNVLIVLHNGGWNNYNFEYLFNRNVGAMLTPAQKRSYPNILRRTQKLFYVCCTRAKDNLVVYYPSPSDEVLEGAVSLFGRDNCIDLDAE